MHQRVLIIGGGVAGLTTAYSLLEKGYGVTVVSKEFPSTRHLPRIASEAAGAWHVPQQMMSSHPASAQEDLAKLLKKWAAYGNKRYLSLCNDSSNTGVCLREFVHLHDKKLDSETLMEYKQMRGFRHSWSLIKEKGLSVSSEKLKDVFSIVVAVIDSPQFLTWLMQQCFRKGAQMIQCSIRGLLREQVQALQLTYGVQFIVNCSGLGSIDLVGDKEMFPVRGGMLKVKNDGSLFPKIDFCVRGPCTSHGPDEDGQEILSPLYIFTRGKEHLLLGAFVQPNRWDHNLALSAPYVQSMLYHCKQLCPRLQALKDSDIQVTVGIRPGRKMVRLEQDPDEPCIFHNYGHYKWGMTLAWGTAADIVQLIDNEVKRLSKKTHLAKL